MCAEALSQEEIDALLRGHGTETDEGDSGLSPEEKEVVSQYAEVFQGASKDVWSMLGVPDMQIRLDSIESLDSKKAAEKFPEQVVLMTTAHEKDLEGPLLVVASQNLALTLAGAMTGGAEELGELEQSALGEGVGQSWGTISTQLQQQMKINTQTKPVQISTHGKQDEDLVTQVSDLGPRVVGVFFTMEAAEQSEPFILILSNSVIDGLLKAQVEAKEAEPKEAQQQAQAQTQTQTGAGGGAEGSVRPAVFEPFGEGSAPGRPGNLELIMDIGLEVRVELGRTPMKIRDVLELGPGAVIELNKLAGEPVDLLVNDRLLARGEVVVIDENFGVRVTDIINMRERIEALGE
jgi:flagellar motor switch protein FliN/FliY